MGKYIFQFGNHPFLSKAEINCILPNFQEKEELSQSFFVYEGTEIKKPQDFIDKIGGSIRIAEFLFASTSFDNLITKTSAHLAKKFGDKRVVFGVSCFSFNENRRILNEIKKKLKSKKLSARFVNRNFCNLDAGTVHKEELFNEKGVEIIIIRKDNKYYTGETIAAQNVEELAKRDFKKPVRDMKVGMLPPKLAMMMINLAAEKGKLPKKIWDPFCGTGTVLVEAQKMGITPIGSDIEDKMIEASEKNFQHFFPDQKIELFPADAMRSLPKKVSADGICAETYLGPIFTGPLSEDDAKKVQKEVGFILDNFLKVFAGNFTGKKAVIALPFWQGKNGKMYFLENALAIIEKFWKNKTAFSGITERGSLLFRRKEQYVGREIFVLEKLG